MFSSIFTKTLYDKRWFIFGWGLGAVAMLGFTAAFFPSIGSSGINTVLESFPPALKGLLGDIQDWSTYQGYMASAVFGLRAEILFVPMAILLGVGLGMGDESSRRLYQIVAKPVSRTRIVLERWLAGVVVIAAIMAVVYGSMVVVSLLIGEEIPYELLFEIMAVTTLFSLALYSLTYGVGVATSRRNIAILLPIVWAMGSLLIDAFKTQIDWIADLEWLSILTYYNTSGLVDGSIDMNNVAVLAAVTLVPLVLGLIVFPRRDIREEA